MKHTIYPTTFTRLLYFCGALAFFFIVFLILYDDGWLPNGKGWTYYTSKAGLTETLSSIGGVLMFLFVILVMSPFLVLGLTFFLASTIWSSIKIKNGKIYIYGAIRFADTSIFNLDTINTIVIKPFESSCLYDGNGTIILGTLIRQNQIQKLLEDTGYTQIDIIDTNAN